MYQYSFEKLDVWQLSRVLVKDVYKVCKQFPAEEKYVLASQLQRAAISVVSNIAEGSSRRSLKDQVRFLEIAYGSLMEVYAQLNVAVDLEYLTTDSFEVFNSQIKEISNKLNALRNSFLKRLETNNQINK